MLQAALMSAAKRPPKNPLLTAIERATAPVKPPARPANDGRRENPLIKLATGKSVMLPTATERAYAAERKRGNNWISDMASVDAALGPNSEHRELMRSVSVLARTDPDVSQARAAEIVRNSLAAIRRGEVDRVKGFVDDGRKLRAYRHFEAEKGRRREAMAAEIDRRNQAPFQPEDLEQALEDGGEVRAGLGPLTFKIGDVKDANSGPGAMVRYFGKAGAGSDNDALLYLRGVDFITSVGTLGRVLDGDSRTYDELSDGEKAQELFQNIVPQVAAGILTGGASASGMAGKVAGGVAGSMTFDLPGIAVAVKDAGGPVKFAQGLKGAVEKALDPNSKMSPVDRASVLGTAAVVIVGGSAAVKTLVGNSKRIGAFSKALTSAVGERAGGLRVAGRGSRGGVDSALAESVRIGGRREISTPGRERAGVTLQVRSLDDLHPSHLPDGTANPRFDATQNASQNRDRSSAAAVARLRSRIKNPDHEELLMVSPSVDRGAPTVGGLGDAVSGHGRLAQLMGMRADNPKAWREYQALLKERYPDAVKGVKDPVLVNVLDDSSPETVARIGRTSNDSSADRLTRFEEAKVNAERLPADVEDRFTMGASKTLQAAAMRRDNEAVVENWIRSLPESERTAARGADGTGISDEYLEKFGQALLLRTLGPDAERMLSTLFVDGEGPKRILGGLEQASADLMDLASAGKRGETGMAEDFRELLGDALGYVEDAMNSRMKNLEWFEQGSFDARRDAAMRMAKAMVGAKTKAEVADLVSRVARAAKEASGGLFGDEVAFKTVDDLVDAALGDVQIGSSAVDAGADVRNPRSAKPVVENRASVPGESPIVKQSLTPATTRKGSSPVPKQKKDLVYPTEKGMAGDLVVTRGGATHRLEDQGTKYEYLTIKGTADRDIRELNKAAKAAMDAGDLREASRLTSEAAARRAELEEDLDDFFVELRRNEGIESGVQPDLDAEFQARVASDKSAHDDLGRVAKKANRQMGGWTRLPFGDLRVIGKALGQLADSAIRQGVAAAEWVADIVKRYGAKIKERAQVAWGLARAKWIQQGEADRAFKEANPNWTKRGALMPKSKKPKGVPGEDYDPFEAIPDALSEHIRIEKDADVIARSVGERIEQIFLNDKVRAVKARKALEKLQGTDLTGTQLDIEEAIFTQNRIGHKIEDAVLRGVVDDEGNRLSMGVMEINDLLKKSGIDHKEWIRYKTALRENELYLQGRGGVDAARAAKNDAYVQAFLEKADGLNQGPSLAEIEREWMRLSDAHLGLFERYGLKEEGWAAKIRAENSFYFPLFKAQTAVEATMREINPSRIASPGVSVRRAKGGGESYIDGFAAMAREIERVIRVGEAMESYRPFFEAAAKEPDMVPWVREITKQADEADDEIVDYATAELDKVFKGEADPIEGQDAVITLVYDGKKRTFEIDPLLWKTMTGDVAGSQQLGSSFLQFFSKIQRTGTTGRLNPLFQLFFNPLIDIQSAMLLHGITPADWVKGFSDAIRRPGTLSSKAFGASRNYANAVSANTFLNSKGISDFLDQEVLFDVKDRSWKSELVDKALKSRGVQVVKSMWDWVGQSGQTMEEATRMAVFNRSKQSALKRGLSEKDASKLAAKDAADTMPFYQAGELFKIASRFGTPYATIRPNIIAAHRKAFKKNPKKYLARAAVLVGTPSILEWMLYKDDPEWANQPAYVKFGSIMFREGILSGKPHEGRWIAYRLTQEIAAPIKLVLYDSMKGNLGAKTSESVAIQEFEQLSTVPLPTLGALLGQQLFYMGDQAVLDARFWRMRAYPLTEDSKDSTRAKNAYRQMVQQIDTAFGSMGRYAVRKWAYEQDKDNPKESQRRETRDPNLLQRFSPEPPRGGKGKKEPAGSTTN